MLAIRVWHKYTDFIPSVGINMKFLKIGLFLLLAGCAGSIDQTKTSQKTVTADTVATETVRILRELTPECRKFRMMYVEMHKFGQTSDEKLQKIYACQANAYYKMPDNELLNMVQNDASFMIGRTEMYQSCLSGNAYEDMDDFDGMMELYYNSIKNCTTPSKK